MFFCARCFGKASCSQFESCVFKTIILRCDPEFVGFFQPEGDLFWSTFQKIQPFHQPKPGVNLLSLLFSLLCLSITQTTTKNHQSLYVWIHKASQSIVDNWMAVQVDILHASRLSIRSSCKEENQFWLSKIHGNRIWWIHCLHNACLLTNSPKHTYTALVVQDMILASINTLHHHQQHHESKGQAYHRVLRAKQRRSDSCPWLAPNLPSWIQGEKCIPNVHLTIILALHCIWFLSSTIHSFWTG